MYDILYILLGLYLLKIIIVVIKKYVFNKNDNLNIIKLISKETNCKTIKNLIKDKGNIFVFNHNKIETDDKKDDCIDREKRKIALEKSRYMCEECGNIANLDVYTNNFSSSSSSSGDELIVLCKKCYEKNIEKMKLHYEA